MDLPSMCRTCWAAHPIVKFPLMSCSLQDKPTKMQLDIGSEPPFRFARRKYIDEGPFNAIFGQTKKPITPLWSGQTDRRTDRRRGAHMSTTCNGHRWAQKSHKRLKVTGEDLYYMYYLLFNPETKICIIQLTWLRLPNYRGSHVLLRKKNLFPNKILLQTFPLGRTANTILLNASWIAFWYACFFERQRATPREPSPDNVRTCRLTVY